LSVTAGSSLAAAAAASASTHDAGRRHYDAHRHLDDCPRNRTRFFDRAAKQTSAARAFSAAGSVGTSRRGFRYGCLRRRRHQHALRLTSITGQHARRNERKDYSCKTRLHVNLLELPNKYCCTRSNNLLSCTFCIAKQDLVATPKFKIDSGEFCQNT
jgi:hypothetical protein